MKKLLIVLIFSFVPGVIAAQEDQGQQIIQLHKYNYFHPYTYTTSERDAGQRSELKYQFSFRIALLGSGSRSALFLAYTQKSVWQIYDRDNSRPFRSTDYNPEVFYRTGGKTFYGDFGYAHESNGREDPTSRSWDTLFLKLKFTIPSFDISLKTWYILGEDQNKGDIFPEKREPIVDFFGYNELALTLKGDYFFWAHKARYNFSTKNGSYETNLSLPLSSRFFLTFQYFFGYGDTLLDYNQSTNRYGLGIMLNR
ncbi:MAG: hypothetical protein HN509_12835 [Halobacteriovoraceae bacterium]|nr:hypothetical protein [Halobacteriovoraceae bacterium]